MDIVKLILKGDTRAAARLLTLIEDHSPKARGALASLGSHVGHAYVVGITGPPGCGKSTLIDRLVHPFRKEGLRVGVLAVDPTSPLTGGAILGDRIRMRAHLVDDGVFIRSLATRGAVGGLPTRTIRPSLKVLEALGMDIVLVETIGAGQDQVSVASVVHSVVVMVSPLMGDYIQTLKSGLMEVADLYVVNKADLGGADSVARGLKDLHGDGKEVPVLKVSALRGTGITELAKTLLQEQNQSNKSGVAFLPRVVAGLRGEEGSWL